MNFSKAKRIVIKIGSSLLISGNALNAAWLKTIAEDIAELVSAGKEVIIVTSGAVALGRHAINREVSDKNSAKLKLEEKQAASACGQSKLMQGYSSVFAPINVAQILITFWDTERRRNYLNARNAIEVLLANGVIPIINENDVIATAELAYGDNDRLSARVAQMLSADLLVLLSDVDGLYEQNPHQHPNAKHIGLVEEISAEIEAMAGGATSKYGTGGMTTKIEAAKIAVNAGCGCVLSSGKAEHALSQIFAKKQKFTFFAPKTTALSARKQWIIGGVKPMGKIFVDAGAAKALGQGKSLLPAGVKSVSGKFERGDLVIILHKDGEFEREIARGLVAYSVQNAKKIIGKKSDEIEEILGYSGRAELIHRDDMVVL